MAIRGTLLLLCLTGCGDASQSADPGDGFRPNVLIYVADTLRVDSLRLYGNDHVETPNLDRLAAEGAFFTQAYAHSPWTRPSIASILTGRYPDGHGVQRRFDALGSRIEGLAERFRAAGYATACITTNPNVAISFGFDRGFDHFVEFFNYSQVDPRSNARLTPSRVANQRAIEWLEGVDEPFFLFVLSMDPHAPHYPPRAFDRYAPDYEGNVDGGFSSLRRLDLRAEDVRRIRSLYDAEVSSNDAALGELVDYLSERGVYDRTLAVFTSDHGEEFWDHGKRGHGKALYQESIRVPLVLRYLPTIAPGQQIERVVQHIDIAPTLLTLAGLPVPSEVEGHHLLEAKDHHPPPAAYAAIDVNHETQRSLVVMPWKLVWDSKKNTAHLYHLSSDPGETVDRIATDAEAAEPLGARLGSRIAEAERRDKSRGAVATTVPEALRRQLEALGYVDEARD